MGDIALCKGIDCPRKDICLRHTQPPRAKWQAWIIQQVSVPDTSVCKFFISNENKLDTNP